MRALLLLTIVVFVSQVACAPPHIERLPLTHSELHELETQARQAHPRTHATLTARDLHPLTPILLAELDDSGSIPAFIVERQVAVNMIEADPEIDTDSDMVDSLAEPEHDMDADDQHTIQTVEDEDNDDALIESEFETSQFGGYGGFGKKGGFGYGSKKIPYKKVPYKKVPYKKVPFKKGPPKKKLPPKKFGGKKGGFGFGGKKGGFGFGGFGYGGFGGGHH